MKPDLQSLTTDAWKFAEANIPEEFRAELAKELVDVVLTAYNTEKPCARAFEKKKGILRFEMRAELVRTPHTTLADKIKLEFFIINNNNAVFLPYE